MADPDKQADRGLWLQKLLRGQIGELLTEPMAVTELARYFDCTRTTMRKRLRHMSGAEPFGARWQVPLQRMPPAYFLDRKLIRFDAA